MLIKEVDNNSVAGLRSQIKKSVDKEDDIDILNRVISVLESGDLLERLEVKLKTDSDAKKMYHHLAKVIVNVPGSLEDKQKFIDNYEKGFVKTNKLLTRNQRISLNEIIPDSFAYAVFDELKEISVMGVGPGEFAFAALSPKIKSVGQTGGGGDLIVDGVKVEVKASKKGEGGKVSGGRLHDAKKAQYDMSSIYNAFEKYYPNLAATTVVGGGDSKSITALNWIGARDNANQEAKKIVSETIAKSTFKFLKNHSKLVDALMNGDEPTIRKAWGEASFDNYKAYAKFDLLMIIDFPSSTTLCVDKISDVMDEVSFESIQLWGAEMSAMPQVKLKKIASTAPGDTQADTDVSKKRKEAEPVKPIKARFEPKNVDTGRSQR